MYSVSRGRSLLAGNTGHAVEALPRHQSAIFSPLPQPDEATPLATKRTIALVTFTTRLRALPIEDPDFRR